MADQNFKHENRERLCYYTNELYDEQDIVKYEMNNRGYGSSFMGDTWTLQLHKDVAKQFEIEGKLNSEWFDNDKMYIETADGYEYYNHEDEIVSLILNIPIIENREYIMNCTNTYDGNLDREEWIRDEYKFGKICTSNNVIDYVALEKAYLTEDISNIPNELEAQSC